tara:strand:- start:45 stop:398 length:354 start_codon:yes stop_codon:yes gene_type:complete
MIKKITLLLIAFTLFSFASNKISERGIVLVHYNANFNVANNYVDVVKIKDAKVLKASIDGNASLKQEERIRSVPTVILYNNGKEIFRWEAGINLSLNHVDYREIQKEVDKITGANQF